MAYSHLNPHRITIAWAGQLFNYEYITEHTGGIEITYRVTYAKGNFWIVRHIQRDTWRQEKHAGSTVLPQVFIDVVGAAIMKDQRPH